MHEQGPVVKSQPPCAELGRRVGYLKTGMERILDRLKLDR